MVKNALNPNPFQEPIWATSGDANETVTHAAVGATLSAWERCETAFGKVYAAFVKPKGETHLVLRAYGSILAAGSRREMIQAAAETYFAVFDIEGQSERLKALLNLYKTGATRRNEIAHGIVQRERSEYFLFPSLYASKKQKLFNQGAKYRPSSKEISGYRTNFDALADQTTKFEKTIRAIYASLPEKLLERYP